MVVARIHDFGRVAEIVQSNWGEARSSSQVLFDEISRIFSDVRHAANVVYEELAVSRGQVQFRLHDADQTHQFCQRVIETFARRNDGIPNPEAHIKLCLGVAWYGVEPASPESRDEARQAATLLAEASQPEEILITAAVFQRLCFEGQKLFGPPTAVRPRADGPEVLGYRRRVNCISCVAGERAVMVVDMRHFSKIQVSAQLMGGPDGVTRLTNQIRTIMATGCASAHKEFKEVLMDFTGDGGIFVFERVEQAHEVAACILEAAERENIQARAKEVPDALRCFRVGIACGELQRDREGLCTGPAIALATRLESGGCSGEIRISPEAYQQLPPGAKRLYGGPEAIQAKAHDGHGGIIQGHRRKVTEPSLGEDPGPPPAINPEFLAPAVEVRGPQECFVISPIDERDPRIVEVFKNLITPACEKLGYKARHANQIPGDDRMAVITRSLANAPMAVAYLGQPMPHWNPDVMLEVGYRFATQRPLVMISEPPLAGPDGRIQPFTKLLPYHLIHKTVLEIAATAQLTVDRLTEEMTMAREAPAGLDWNWVHPVMEFCFSNPQDLQMIETSPQARALFDLPQASGPQSMEEMRKRNRERFEEVQYKFFREEQWEIIRKIRDAAMFAEAENHTPIPAARVPVILKNAPVVNGKPTGYLPVTVRHATSEGRIHLQTLYLKVCASLRQDPRGHWACDL